MTKMYSASEKQTKSIVPNMWAGSKDGVYHIQMSRDAMRSRNVCSKPASSHPDVEKDAMRSEECLVPDSFLDRLWIE